MEQATCPCKHAFVLKCTRCQLMHVLLAIKLCSLRDARTWCMHLVSRLTLLTIQHPPHLLSKVQYMSLPQYTVSSENAPYISRHGYATCHRRSSSAGERLTNMREAVRAAHSTAGIANSAGKLPLQSA